MHDKTQLLFDQANAEYGRGDIDETRWAQQRRAAIERSFHHPGTWDEYVDIEPHLTPMELLAESIKLDPWQETWLRQASEPPRDVRFAGSILGHHADRVIVDEIAHGCDASLGPDPKPMNWSANLAKEARAVIQPDLHGFALPVIEPPTKLAIPAHWSFRDKDVAAGFDDHVREQLPWYDLVTGAVAQIARHYLPEHGMVWDLGCSTGNVGRALAKDLDERNGQLLAVDEAPEMIDLYRGPGELVTDTISSFLHAAFQADHKVDVVVCFLSLMFTPADTVAEAVANIVERIRPGGALIVVDRLTPDHGYAGLVKTRLTLAGKLAAGASATEILHKELSLAGVQRPLPIDLFDEYDPIEFFRFADFTGLLIERPLT